MQHAYALLVNRDRTLYVRLWENGTAEYATREHPAHTWGPPRLLTEERHAASPPEAPAQVLDLARARADGYRRGYAAGAGEAQP